MLPGTSTARPLPPLGSMNTCMLLLPLPAETKAGSVAAPAGAKDSARLALPAWAVQWANKGLLAGVPGCDSRAGWAGLAARVERLAVPLPLATGQSAAVACALMLRYGQRAMPCLRASFCEAGVGAEEQQAIGTMEQCGMRSGATA